MNFVQPECSGSTMLKFAQELADEVAQIAIQSVKYRSEHIRSSAPHAIPIKKHQAVPMQ